MSSNTVASQKYVLGLDLGSASLGWALIVVDESGKPESLLHAGVRIFEPGVDGTALEIQEGKDKSKAVERRTARLHRRQLRRRAYRQAKLFQLLQQNGLLPHGDSSGQTMPSEERDSVLTALDQSLYQKWRTSSVGNNFAQLPLYQLRKIALDDKLEPYEIGRILYHFSQRRGFKSNRKEGGKESEKELGAVKAGIADLAQKKESTASRTLGEYFAGLDPHKAGENVRRRWTARKMYEDEFAQIWAKQATYDPGLLTEDLRREVSHWLFYQRPIAAQSHLIGKCELEGPSHRRAAWATLEAQRFRILQKVNDLKIIYPGNPIAQPLGSEERKFVFDLLDREGDQTFVKLRQRLKLDKKSQFNLERGDEKRLRGNRTNKAMLAVFGQRWNTLSAEEQKQVVEDWRTSESDEALMRRGIEHWGLDGAAAQELVAAKPEDGHCALSRKAILRLLPQMFEGISFKEAETRVYGDRFSGGLVLDELPPLHIHRKIKGSGEAEKLLAKLRLGAIRNPAVERALTELRKVVNAVLREYGKPHEIRIELARELKKPRNERESATKQNRTRQKEREKAKADLLRECGIQNPSRPAVEKALLHAECGGICPYTGRAIAFRDLFGAQPLFEVEHIIPISRYPDDSFQNKTLCWHEENRLKRNRTPFEAYSGDIPRWEAMQTRINAWKPGNPGKLKRFMLRSEDELEAFTARQMNDTRYASVLASRLLETLYGGRDVANGNGNRQVIFTSSGAVTATLRRSWGLEAILHELVPPEPGDSQGKPRTDHRHHAIDAIVIALTSPQAIHAMARAASLEPWQSDARAWRKIESPWKDFVASVRPHIERMLVSHRPDHKLSGELHKGTNYSIPRSYNGKPTVHTRVALSDLSVADIASQDVIVDRAVGDAIRKKLEELDNNPKLFEKPENTPYLTTRSGRAIPIRKVRIRETRSPIRVGSGVRTRYVASGGIHHVALFVTRNDNRQEVWDSNVVQITEAYERRRKRVPVVSRELKDATDAAFVFSMMKDDTIEITDGNGTQILRVKKFGDNKQIWFVPVNDAHDDSQQKKLGITWSKKPNTLKQLRPRKVVIDLLGKVHPAND